MVDHLLLADRCPIVTSLSIVHSFIPDAIHVCGSHSPLGDNFSGVTMVGKQFFCESSTYRWAPNTGVVFAYHTADASITIRSTALVQHCVIRRQPAFEARLKRGRKQKRTPSIHQARWNTAIVQARSRRTESETAPTGLYRRAYLCLCIYLWWLPGTFTQPILGIQIFSFWVYFTRTTAAAVH